MSKSFGNLPTNICAPTNFYTLQKHQQNNIVPTLKWLDDNCFANESVPLPAKRNVTKNNNTKINELSSPKRISNQCERDIEDYDEPAIKHHTSNSRANNQQQFEDYDEPVIKHSLAIGSTRSEFEDYDEPIHHARVARKHNRIH